MASRATPTTTPNVVAAASGDRRLALEALRDTLAAVLDACDPNMAAQVAGQYRAALKELAELGPAVAEESPLDRLAAARAARRAGPRAATRRLQQPTA